VNLLLDDDAAVRGEAFKMVTALGAAAAPTLLELAADLFLADPGEASVSRKIPKQWLPEFSRRVVLLLCQLQDMRAVPALLAAASQRDRGIHGPAKGYLDTLTASERGSSVLVAALQHPVTAVRARALSVLQQRPDNVPLETLTGLLEDASAEIRALAAELIGRAGNAAGIDPLAGMLDDDDPGVRVAAAVALARLKDKRGADILLEALRKGNEDPRALVPVIRAVGWIRERRAFELVRPFLDPKQAKTEACLSAIETAGQLGGPEAREALLPFLKAHVWHSRHARSPLRLACRSLAAMGDPEAFEPLANVVRRKTSDRDYSGVRDAVEGVLKLDPARGVPVVLERLGVCKPYEESILLHLAGALGATGDTRVIEPLLGLTVSDLAKVREAAAEALVEIGGSPGGIAKLVAHMDATTARGRASLSEVLAEMGEPAREPVLEALTAASAKIRQGAAWTLGKRGDRAAVDPLIGRLGDTNQHVRAAAAWALGVLNDRRATGPLLAMLSDPELKPRMGAAEALGSLGATNAVEALVGIARDDTNSTMRAAAVYALGRLGAVKALDAAPTDASAGGTAEP
jgi:HEAT repeat protein